jgi:translation elongation factor EF-Tu-like GTPase
VEFEDRSRTGAVELTINDVFTRSERGLGVTGLLVAGEIAVGDRLWLHAGDARHQVTVQLVERLRECFGPAVGGGRGVALRLAGVAGNEIRAGMLLRSEP